MRRVGTGETEKEKKKKEEEIEEIEEKKQTKEEEEEEAVVACEQAAFARERVCNACPAPQWRAGMAWMAAWTRFALRDGLSYAAFRGPTCIAFSINGEPPILCT